MPWTVKLTLPVYVCLSSLNSQLYEGAPIGELVGGVGENVSPDAVGAVEGAVVREVEQTTSPSGLYTHFALRPQSVPTGSRAESVRL